jgi:hypothetical protein
MSALYPASVQKSEELAKAIREAAELIGRRFTPAALTCVCGGAELTCRNALDDGRTWERYETVGQIKAYMHEWANLIDVHRCVECDTVYLNHYSADVCARHDKAAHDAAYDPGNWADGGEL